MPRRRSSRNIVQKGQYDATKTLCAQGQGKRSRNSPSTSTSHEMLDSKIFEHYFEKIWNGLSEDKQHSFLFIDSLWFNIYANGNKERVLKWISRKDIFSKKYIIVPIVLWSHWSLLILCGFNKESDFVERCMLLLDSFHSANQNSLESTIRNFILDIHETKGMSSDSATLNRVPLLIPKVPQQTGGVECGHFVLYYAYLFIQNAPERFTLDGYPYFMREDWFTLERFNEFSQALSSLENAYVLDDVSSDENVGNDSDIIVYPNSNEESTGQFIGKTR